MAKANRRLPAHKPRRNFSLLNRVLGVLKTVSLALCGIGLLSIIGFYGFKSVNQFLNRPIAQIVVNGQFQYVSREDVRRHIEGVLGASFISENIHRIQKDIASMPWVDTVSLSRSWPDTLNVTVDEHVPIARWGSGGFVNVKGELVFTDKVNMLSHLPELSGQESGVGDVMEKYSLLARVFQRYGMSIHYLQQDDRQSWRIDLSNSWRVIFGRDDVLEKASRLTHLLDLKLIEKEANISTIDLRYSNGVSVKWRQADSEYSDSLQVDDSKYITSKKVQQRTLQ